MTPGTSSSCRPSDSRKLISKFGSHILHKNKIVFIAPDAVHLHALFSEFRENVMRKFVISQSVQTIVCRDKELFDLRNKACDASQELNAISTTDKAARESKIRQLLGKVGSNPFITPPFACDYGCHITAGIADLSPLPESSTDIRASAYMMNAL